ncbi:NAD(P)-binding domain-containing protein [Hoeflea prorocentri]|uniref:NAD(P)-binding domain-containing protein n=1 Tax=Hoeflea prorocentri TaxID=1922333 RepID=A0A9X3UGZ7_9HYPH|nr:NAD(P)-binding domain-containing protein [Hoeflea prorocentri]MCY6381213.1 NAD(P)-binding domain-containing protein [Hoeflea prorocentri]MDA5399013.1 NAD(P)-binding domain-containing protein [Hoeflea prorocentri]
MFVCFAFLCFVFRDGPQGKKEARMRIAIIGTGSVGSALAHGWASTHHEIILGSRHLQTQELRDLKDQTGAKALPAAEAAEHAHVVVLALPWTAAKEALATLGDLSGKIIIDCMNPLEFADGALRLDRGWSTSGAETVAAWLPGARIVKTLNQVGADVMRYAGSMPARPAMFLASDDTEAKETVAGLLEGLGFDPLDAGSLDKARLLEPFAMVWINQAMARGKGRRWALSVVDLSDLGEG